MNRPDGGEYFSTKTEHTPVSCILMPGIFCFNAMNGQCHRSMKRSREAPGAEGGSRCWSATIERKEELMRGKP